MRWVTTTHVRHRRTQTKSVGEGYLYQGAYKSFPIDEDNHLTTVIRYVEKNPLLAKLVLKAEDWQWSSLQRRERNNETDRKLLSSLPAELPTNYSESVNTILNDDSLKEVRHSIKKGTPFGSDVWIGKMVEKYNLGNTLRGPGRPKSV